MRRLYLVRGLPGSGKSTFAKRLLTTRSHDTVHYEADDYFVGEDGEYRFDPKKLPMAHQRCFENTLIALSQGFDVVVSNTFTQLWEMDKYLDISTVNDVEVEIWVFAMTESFGSIHGVPEDTLKKMRDRWQPLFGENLICSTEMHTKLISPYKKHVKGEPA